MKENARIEKTALFVSRQGMQMEILIKAKQGDNPQFAFLNQGNELYKYYRHLLSAIKDGRYRVQPEETQGKSDFLNVFPGFLRSELISYGRSVITPSIFSFSAEQTSETLSDQEHHEETYLHPLLTQPVGDLAPITNCNTSSSFRQRCCKWLCCLVMMTIKKKETVVSDAVFFFTLSCANVNHLFLCCRSAPRKVLCYF